MREVSEALEPMWYAASAETIDRAGGPVARGVLAAARARWDRVAIDVQRLRLAPGEFAVSPVARAIHDPRWQATGPGDEVLIAAQAAHAVVEVGGRALPSDGIARVMPAAAEARGIAWPASAEPGEVIVALARRATADEILDRPRRSSRRFAPPPERPPATLPDWAAERPLVFQSGYRVLGRLDGFGPEDIAGEPVPTACHPTWLAAHGGPIARAFVAALPEDWRTPEADVIVNAKINEFDPGWYSCLAGWHIDGTSRIKKRSDGSPDLLNPGRYVEQIGCSVGPTGATGFLVGDIALPVTPIGGDGRGVWQRVLLDAIADGSLKAVQAPVQTVVKFDYGDFHTCQPSERVGWRYFIKAMRGRGDVPDNAFAPGSGLSWPLDAGRWPDDPLGVFPPVLPFFDGIAPALRTLTGR